jgi:hypothetical protein
MKMASCRAEVWRSSLAVQKHLLLVESKTSPDLSWAWPNMALWRE